jgi:hypothetical protein
MNRILGMLRISAALLAGVLACLPASSACAQSAYVYLPTSQGIYGYSASAAGKLTLIPGSPFTQTSGLAVGSNGKYFLTVGTDWLHVYAVTANGAIGKQVSQIDTQTYGGAVCGATASGEFAHNGVDIFVQLAGATNADGSLVCDDIQTYGISAAGALTYKGNLEFSKGSAVEAATLPGFVGTSNYGYNLEQVPGDGEDYGDIPFYFNALQMEPSGALELAPTTSVTGPAGDGFSYSPMAFAAGPGNSLVAMVEAGIGSYGCACQMASYTETNGKLVSTNTYENMPYWPDTWTGPLQFNPAGTLLALGVAPGVQLFHFNGAKPITAYTGILGESSGHVAQLGWDTSNHLYAINVSSGKLHVYNATTTSVTEAAGSPILLPNNAMPTGNSLLVRAN